MFYRDNLECNQRRLYMQKTLLKRSKKLSSRQKTRKGLDRQGIQV